MQDAYACQTLHFGHVLKRAQFKCTNGIRLSCMKVVKYSDRIGNLQNTVHLQLVEDNYTKQLLF